MKCVQVMYRFIFNASATRWSLKVANNSLQYRRRGPTAQLKFE